MWVAALVLGLTYVGIATNRLPRVNLDRASAALIGGLLMVLLGVLTFQQAIQAVDFNTIALLFGMMLLVAALQQVGFFTLLATWALSFGRTPHRLMVLVVVSTGLLSAFLVNDAVVLLLTPVVVSACRMLRANPVPFLIAEAMASNISSTATMVGNPQNALIGVTSGISFARFFLYLFPVALVSSAILLLVMLSIGRKQMRLQTSSERVLVNTGRAVYKPGLMRIAPVVALAVVGFFASSYIGLSVPMVALVVGALALVVSGVRPSELIQRVDWTLLVFFAGLFVVIGGARQAGVLDLVGESVRLTPDMAGMGIMHLVSAGASQVVSNVPLTMLVLPIIKNTPGDMLWISLAAGSTLGGNATLVGAVANLIVAEVALREGVSVGFAEFARIGIVVTLLTIAASVGILALEIWLGLLR